MKIFSVFVAALLLSSNAQAQTTPSTQEKLIDFEDLPIDQPPVYTLESAGHKIYGGTMTVKGDPMPSEYFSGRYLQAHDTVNVSEIPPPASGRVSFSWGCNQPCAATLDMGTLQLKSKNDGLFEYGRVTLTRIKNLSSLIIRTSQDTGVIHLDNVTLEAGQ